MFDSEIVDFSLIFRFLKLKLFLILWEIEDFFDFGDEFVDVAVITETISEGPK